MVTLVSGSLLANYTAVIGGVVSGEYPVTFMINGQQVGSSQHALLQPGVPDFSRTIVIFQTSEPDAISMPVGTSMTAELMWCDVFGNVEALGPALQVKGLSCKYPYRSEHISDGSVSWTRSMGNSSKHARAPNALNTQNAPNA